MHDLKQLYPIKFSIEVCVKNCLNLLLRSLYVTVTLYQLVTVFRHAMIYNRKLQRNSNVNPVFNTMIKRLRTHISLWCSPQKFSPMEEII